MHVDVRPTVTFILHCNQGHAPLEGERKKEKESARAHGKEEEREGGREVIAKVTCIEGHAY